MIKLAELLTEAIEYFKPTIAKNPVHPNFLTVNIKYPVGGGGALVALGSKTASGQQREEGAAKALAMANKVAEELQKGMQNWVKDQILKLAGNIKEDQFKKPFGNN